MTMTVCHRPSGEIRSPRAEAMKGSAGSDRSDRRTWRSGAWKRAGGICDLITGHLEDLSPLLGELRTKRRQFR